MWGAGVYLKGEVCRQRRLYGDIPGVSKKPP